MIKELSLYAQNDKGLTAEEIGGAIAEAVVDLKGSGKRLLLIVPDVTRYHSNAGLIANLIYHQLDDCRVDLLPALGTHVPMTEEECTDMYGDIPFDRFLVHNWRTDIKPIGTVPADFVREVSEGLMDQEVKVEINQQIVDGGYDLILSIGQVVPHEVVGMANHSKNVLVGCGGSEIINFSHILGAFYGMERLMGKDFSPVRLVFDYAADHFLKDLPLSYILTVTTAPEDQIRTHGLFIGRDRSYFEQAVALSQEKNIIFLDKPIKKALVYLDPKEFKSTWLGNKSIYRTRMAIADGGDLIVLAPGVDKFGEDEAVDALIRKYGYCGRKKVIELCRTRQDLADNLAAAAHLIHGSSDDRFKITYCTKLLSGEEIEGVHFDYAPYEEMRDRYNPDSLVEGYNTMPDGEEIFYISNPALGLWIDRGKFA